MPKMSIKINFISGHPLETWEMPPGVGVDLACHHPLAMFAYHSFRHIFQAIAAPFSFHNAQDFDLS
jgi:hypothetical protein